MILTIEDKKLFETIIRAEKEFKQFTSDYKQNEVNLFDCQIYSQNFNIIINELNKKINNYNFVNRPDEEKDKLLKYLNYFIQGWQLIESMRIEKSSIKIFINEFSFSQN